MSRPTISTLAVTAGLDEPLGVLGERRHQRGHTTARGQVAGVVEVDDIDPAGGRIGGDRTEQPSAFILWRRCRGAACARHQHQRYDR